MATLEDKVHELDKKYSGDRKAVIAGAVIATVLLGALFGLTWDRAAASAEKKLTETGISSAIKNIMDANETAATFLAEDWDPLPVGTIVASMLTPTEMDRVTDDVNRIPTERKWALANGDSISEAWEYHAVTELQTLPNLSGMFMRGIDPSGQEDPDGSREPGSTQKESYAPHEHHLFAVDKGVHPSRQVHAREFPVVERSSKDNWNYSILGTAKSPTLGLTSTEGKDETRPKNVAVYFYIKVN